MIPKKGLTLNLSKVGYSTESRSVGVDRLALRNQTNCYSKTNFIVDVSLVRSTGFIRAY